MESDLPDWAMAEAAALRGAVVWQSNAANQVIARALVAAERRGIERAVHVAEEYVWDDHALEQATDIGRAVHYQSQEIVTAIRQIGGEGC